MSTDNPKTTLSDLLEQCGPGAPEPADLEIWQKAEILPQEWDSFFDEPGSGLDRDQPAVQEREKLNQPSTDTAEEKSP